MRKVMAISEMFVSKKKEFTVEWLCKYKNKWVTKEMDVKKVKIM